MGILHPVPFFTACSLFSPHNFNKPSKTSQGIHRFPLTPTKKFFGVGSLTISSKRFFFLQGEPVYDLTWQQLVKTQSERPKDASWGPPQDNLLKWIKGFHGEGGGVENSLKTAASATCGAVTDKHTDTNKGPPQRHMDMPFSSLVVGTPVHEQWLQQRLLGLNKASLVVVIEGLQDTRSPWLQVNFSLNTGVSGSCWVDEFHRLE